MKIAISSSGKTLDSMVDPRFGRAVGIVFYDMDTGAFEYKDNLQNQNAVQGAGIQSAKLISDEKADALITGHCGPKAFMALKAARVKVYSGAAGTVAETIEKFKSGDLVESMNADVEGHWK